MEKVFNKRKEEFFCEMYRTFDETYEEYQEFIPAVPKTSDITVVLHLMTAIYLYTKSLPETEWKTSLMIRILQDIAFDDKLEEILIKKNLDNIRTIERLQKEDKVHVQLMAIFTGMVLEYYFRIYEKQYHDEDYGREVESALYDLITLKPSKLLGADLDSKSDKPIPVRTKEYLDTVMTGQETAKKTVSMAIYRFIEYGERSVILLEGPTGVGKTFLFQNLASCESLRNELTFYSYPATQMTPNGFIGDNVEDLLQGYKKQCEYRRGVEFEEEEKTMYPYKGVIFLDEFDKLLIPNFGSRGEDSNQIVLNQLLTVLEGTAQIAGIDTSQVMFILAGAFEELKKEGHEKKKQGRVGFALDDETDFPEKTTYDLREEMECAGVSKQIIGRITHFVHMNNLSREELRTILTNPQNGLLTRWDEMFERDGLKLKLEDDTVIESMLDLIMKSNTGARGIKERLASIIGNYDYDMLEKGLHVMILHNKVFEGIPPRIEKE